MEILNLARDSKGNIGLDLIVFLAAVFIFAIVISFTNIIQNDVNDEIQNDDEVPDEIKQISQDTLESSQNIWDNAFVFFFMLLWIAMIVTSFFIDTHPVFFVISVLLLFFIVIIAGYMANTYEDFTTDEDLADFAGTFPKMDYIFGHLIQFVLAIFATTALALYGKSRVGP